MCKYIQPNLTIKHLCYLRCEKIQGERFGHSPGWTNETLGWCFWLYPCSHHRSACSHVLLHPFTHVSPLGRTISLGSFAHMGRGCCSWEDLLLFAFRPPLRSRAITESLSSQAAWNPPQKGTTGLTPCLQQLLWELMATPAMAASS